MSREIFETPPPISLDPHHLYTTETSIYASQLSVVDMGKPVLCGVDAFGVRYIIEGNHRSRRSLDEGIPLWGTPIAHFNGSVADDPDFRLISELIILP
jgi:hypothetical protein